MRKLTKGVRKQGMGKVRHVPCRQHFTIYLSSSTFFYLTMLIFLHSLPVNPLLSDLLLCFDTSISHFRIHQTLHNPYLPCQPDYQLCLILPMSFACHTCLLTSHGHAFILTIIVSRLNKYKEKHCLPASSITTSSARQTYQRQPAPHMPAMS